MYINMKHEEVLLVGRASVATNVVYNALASRFRVRLVLEEPPSRAKLLRWRIRNVGLFRALGQLLFLVLAMAPIRAASGRRRRDILAHAGLSTAQHPVDRTGHTPSVNSPHLAALIAEAPPGLVVINGTRIVTSRTLQAWKVPVLNMHAGITPLYRGVHGAYWALVRDDRAHCGVTVHLVDAGLDTGGILRQGLIAPTRKDNFTTYPALQLAVGTPLLVRAVEDVLTGNSMPHAAGGIGQRWHHPTLGEYLWNCLTKGIR